MIDLSFLKNLPVYKTITINKFDDISKTAQIMVKDYVELEKAQEFSYRILLPRGESHNDRSAKKLGLNLQMTFLSLLRKQQIKMRLREIKYIHDSSHFGWILLSLNKYEKLFQS